MRLWGLMWCCLIGSLFVACGGQRSPASDQILNVYNWGNFIGPDTISDFERETGIKINYSTFSSDAMLETRLLAGHSDFDLVVPSDTSFERLVKADVFKELNTAALSNRKDLSPDIMASLASRDPGNLHGIPYLWSTTGIGYNADMIQKRLGVGDHDSWSLLFDPKNAEKLRDCGIMIVDSPFEVYATVLLYLGKDPNSEDPADINLAADTLIKIRPYVRVIASEGIVDGFSSGGLCAILGWAGDISTAKNRSAISGTTTNLVYFLSKEGSLIGVDVLAIPADAPHAANALRFIDYLTRPDVIAKVTNAVRYPNAVEKSLGLVNDEIKNMPALYPDANARTKLHLLKGPSPEKSRLVTRLWAKFRTGN